LVIRPHWSGYVYAGVMFLLTAILWVIAQAMHSIKSPTDVIIAWIVFSGFVFYGITSLFSTALPKVTVDDDAVLARDPLGRHRRFARSEVSHAAMRSILVPTRYGFIRADALFLVGKDGRSLLRLPADDYDTGALERLVETLGLEWPETKSASVRQIRREFPGAFAFDFQTIAIAILIILAVALAVITLAVWFR